MWAHSHPGGVQQPRYEARPESNKLDPFQFECLPHKDFVSAKGLHPVPELGYDLDFSGFTRS